MKNSITNPRFKNRTFDGWNYLNKTQLIGRHGEVVATQHHDPKQRNSPSFSDEIVKASETCVSELPVSLFTHDRKRIIAKAKFWQIRHFYGLSWLPFSHQSIGILNVEFDTAIPSTLPNAAELGDPFPNGIDGVQVRMERGEDSVSALIRMQHEWQF